LQDGDTQEDEDEEDTHGEEEASKTESVEEVVAHTSEMFAATRRLHMEERVCVDRVDDHVGSSTVSDSSKGPGTTTLALDIPRRHGAGTSDGHDRPHIFVCTDGGSRDKLSDAAAGWIAYDSEWAIMDYGGLCLGNGTNNDAEFRAALEGIRRTTRLVENHTIVHLTDSSLVERGLTGTVQLNHQRHRITTKVIQHLQGQSGNTVVTYQIPRRFNAGADRICNMCMDKQSNVSMNTHRSVTILDDLHSDGQSTCGFYDAVLAQRLPSAAVIHFAMRHSIWAQVTKELLFKHGPSPLVCTPTCIPPGGAIRTIETNCGADTGFGTHPNSFMVDSKERSIPPSVYERIKSMCKKHNIKWHANAFVIPEDSSVEPTEDIRILTAVCKAVNNDVKQVIRLVRGQTDADNRPSKHLRPDLYALHLKDYPGLSDLCDIARNGFTSRAQNFIPARPPNKNHRSAVERAPAVQKRLYKAAHLRRSLIIDSDVSLKDPGVNPMPFAVAPKKGLNYEEDGRLIHDASFPKGNSLNDAVPDVKLDAKTDDVINIARRAIQLYLDFPGVFIAAMCADVDAGFNNAPASEAASLHFSGQIPGTTYMSIALTAIFGYTDSPAIFALFAKAAQYYHKNAPQCQQFWNWLWVDDFVCMEPDVGTLLHDSEARLRASFELIFGSPGWNNDKYVPWSNRIHAVGLDWNLADGTVSIPSDKIEKAQDKIQSCLDSCLNLKPPTLHEWRSLVGTLRHISTCVPGTRPFFQKFVSTEKILSSKGLPVWEDLTCDLEWFQNVLNTSHLNGVTMERFATTSDRVELLYLGWTNDVSYIIDFHTEGIVSQPVGGSVAAATLLEWYICKHKITPHAFGPFPRTDTLIHVACQTSLHARKLNNWGLPDHSLRALGWHCIQQHLQLSFSGPKLGSINFTNHTNLLLQVLETGQTSGAVEPFCLQWESRLKLSSAPELRRQVGPLTVTSSRPGKTFADSLRYQSTLSTNSPGSNKIVNSLCLPPIAALDTKIDRPCAPKPLKAYVYKPLSPTTRNGTTIKSLKARAWIWQWRATAVTTLPTSLNACHLVLPCSANSASSCFLRDPVNPSSSGGMLSSPSVHWQDREKSGGLSRESSTENKWVQTISLDGETLPMDQEMSNTTNQAANVHGLTYILNHPKEIGTKKELPHDSQRPTILISAQFEQCATSNADGNYSRSKTPTKVSSLNVETDHSTVPPSTNSSSVSLEPTTWTTPESLVTQSGSEVPHSSWLQVLAKRSSSWLEDGTRSVTRSIYG
jgi:ribonuclease HI